METERAPRRAPHRGRCGSPPLLVPGRQRRCGLGAAALPTYLTGCAHPTRAMGPHGAPFDDDRRTPARLPSQLLR
jgi:hypothetical protein